MATFGSRIALGSSEGRCGARGVRETAVDWTPTEQELGLRAFVFPGQGAQHVGMGRDVFAASAEAREVLRRADAVAGEPAVSELAFDADAATLRRTEHAQPTILATSVAMLHAARATTALSADVVAGHSLGEYTALVAAGVVELEDAIRLVRLRGQLMEAAVPAGEGAMAAIRRLDLDAVRQLCSDAAEGAVLEPANINSPQQIVVSGHAAAVERAAALARQRRAVARKLQVSGPFHCSLMQPAQRKLAAALERAPFRDARIPVVTNVAAQPETRADRLRELLVEQVTAPVWWQTGVEAMLSMGVQEVYEIGPGRTLARLVQQIAPDLPVTSLDSWEQIAAFAQAPAGGVSAGEAREPGARATQR